MLPDAEWQLNHTEKDAASLRQRMPVNNPVVYIVRELVNRQQSLCCCSF